MTDAPGSSYLDLYDFRVQVSALYRERNRASVGGDDPATTVASFRRERDRLFAEHPQSALDAEQKGRFHGLDYFSYNPEAAVEATVDTRVEPLRVSIQLADDEVIPLSRAAILHFALAGEPLTLTMYWIEIYGGGLFLPFRDRTAPHETYGGGRYLFDTVKGSDFQWLPDRDSERCLLLDFNYAYNPSCAYNPRWVCPLAPRENDLAVSIPAGEKRFIDSSAHP